MKRWTPADPAKFRPLLFRSRPPFRNTRAMLEEQQRVLGLPSPARVALAAFVLVSVVIL